MKKIVVTFMLFLFSFAAYAHDFALSQDNDDENFQKVADVAQYGRSDWKNVIGAAHNISLAEAFTIAKGNPEITYFFYTKQYMVLISYEPFECYRIFNSGDAIFFSGKPWWGSAAGYADGYIKK